MSRYLLITLMWRMRRLEELMKIDKPGPDDLEIPPMIFEESVTPKTKRSTKSTNHLLRDPPKIKLDDTSDIESGSASDLGSFDPHKD